MDILDGLYRLSPNTITSAREGYTLKQLSDDFLLQNEQFRQRWLSKVPQENRPYVRGEAHAAQLARLAWLYFEARILYPERERPVNDYIFCLKELNRLTTAYIASPTASQLSTSTGTSAQRQAVRDREKAILVLKKRVEACLYEWNNAQFAARTPTIEFQERYSPPADRRAVSAPSEEVRGKRKKPGAKNVAASPGIAAPAPNVEPPPSVVPLQSMPAAELVPLPNMEYDYAPLPDGTAVMLWSEYVDSDGAVREVPIEGRTGYRPAYGPLAPGWKRDVVVDGVELVATQIQCGWARLRKV